MTPAELWDEAVRILEKNRVEDARREELLRVELPDGTYPTEEEIDAFLARHPHECTEQCVVTAARALQRQIERIDRGFIDERRR